LLLFGVLSTFASSPQLLLNVGISNVKVEFDRQTQITLCSTSIFSQQIENMTDEILGEYKNYFKVINRSNVTSLIKAWKMRQMGLVESTQTIYKMKPLDVVILINVYGVKNNLYITYKFLHLDGTEAFPTKNFTVSNVVDLNQVLNNCYEKIESMIKNLTSRIFMKIISTNDKNIEVYTYGKNVNVGDILEVLSVSNVEGVEKIGKVKVDKVISSAIVECNVLSSEKSIKVGEFCVPSRRIILNVKTDKSIYSIGNPITINVNSNSDCYIYIFDVRKNGENVSLLFPIELYPPLRDNFISKNSTLSLPYYEASKPVGKDEIVVFGSRLRLKSRNAFDSDAEYYEYVSQMILKEEGSRSDVEIEIVE
jgi:hypothetical protein